MRKQRLLLVSQRCFDHVFRCMEYLENKLLNVTRVLCACVRVYACARVFVCTSVHVRAHNVYVRVR